MGCRNLTFYRFRQIKRIPRPLPSDMPLCVCCVSCQVRAILGEMRVEGGEVAVKGKLAYVAQSAWVPNDSLRNAVLFGQSLDRTKYAHTLQACGLLPDLALLEVRRD